MSTSDLSPAGSSTYSSNTLHVGDGTWDSGRDDFLLPNLVGLNFDTMRYNGMGNRFRDLPEYHRLILGHGVIAAIVFIGIVPAAIFIAKYYRRNPRLAVKFHVYLQILTVFLTTVVLILGWFAVGPERSLTNPHHGIGVAIYVCVLVQFIYGWMMSRLEKRRTNFASLTRLPAKVWIHKLFGRSIALLGFVQIALGLTLYGSPKVLFILYALAGAILLFWYMALDRYYFVKKQLVLDDGGGPEFYSDYGSYLSGSRTDYTQDNRRRPPPERERSHWGRDLLAAGGLLGAYEAFKHRRNRKSEEREEQLIEAERRQRPGPPGIAPSGVSSRPSSRPPPGVSYGAGAIANRPGSRPPPERHARIAVPSESRMSPESWEDEKYSERPRHTWRDRLLGVGAGIAAFEGFHTIFRRRKRREEEDYVDSSYRPPLGGNQNMVSQTDISRVQQGQAPISPNAGGRQERVNIAGVQPMTPTATPSRQQRRRRASMDSLSYDEEESVTGPGRPQHLRRDEVRQDEESHTLRNSIVTMGAIAGFREWNRNRRERRERQREERMRREEMDNEEEYNRRTSMNYPRPQDAGGRRPSVSGTVTTGATDFEASNVNMRPDTRHPPLPATAATIQSGSGAGPSTVGPSISQQRIVDPNAPGYQLPPPPPGPPPGGIRRDDYRAPEPGSLQMPQGAVTPDPGRLLSHENVVQQYSSQGQGHPIRDVTAGALFGAAAADLATGRRRWSESQSESPSRYNNTIREEERREDSRTRAQRREEREDAEMREEREQAEMDAERRRQQQQQRPNEGGRTTLTSETNTTSTPGPGPGSPPVSVKVKMHNDGRHVTLRRLSEQEAEAERAARRAERRSRRRRGSSLSSIDDAGAGASVPPGSNTRYRRNGGGGRIRASSQQPIENVPPPPPMSIGSSGVGQHRPSSELNLPSPPGLSSGPPRPPTHSISPQGGGGGGLSSPPPAPGVGSGMSGGVSPGDAGNGTDVSAFADNRRRRRAERARRLEAARGNRVEFQ